MKDRKGNDLNVGDKVRWIMTYGGIVTHKLRLRTWKNQEGKKVKRVQLENGLWLTPSTATRIEKVFNN